MTPDVPSLPATTSVDAALDALRAAGRPASIVGPREQMLGIVTTEHLARSSNAGRGHQTVESVLEHTFVHVHADHPLDVVLERLSESPELLPVVDRADVRRVEGVITADHIAESARRRRATRARDGIDAGDRRSASSSRDVAGAAE